MASPLPGVDLVSALKEVKDSLRGDVLEALDASAVRELAEVALNVILGTIPASREQLDALRRHKQDLLELTGAKTSGARRRALLKNPRLFHEVATIVDNVGSEI